MIGTFGTKIIFRVSDEQILTFRNFSRDTAGRWATHTAIGSKPKAEFLGAENQKLKFDILLSATLGVKPRDVLEAIEKAVESGEVEYLVVGNRPVGKNPFRLMSASESWNTVFSRGELVSAEVSLSLEEYV